MLILGQTSVLNISSDSNATVPIIPIRENPQLREDWDIYTDLGLCIKLKTITRPQVSEI